MKYQLFSPEIEPCCAFCEHGRTAPDGKTVLCIKKGVVLPGDRCRKYREQAITLSLPPMSAAIYKCTRKFPSRRKKSAEAAPKAPAIRPERF